MMDNRSNNEEKMSDHFNPMEAVAILRAEARERIGPKMTIGNKMHAFALLRAGVSHGIVAKMFRISKPSVSNLANCLRREPGRTWHYPDVFIEWRRLGEEAFLSAYLTEENFLEAQRQKASAGYEIEEGGQLHLTSNPRADSKSHALIGSIDLGSWRARIDWTASGDPAIPPEKLGPAGWRYAIAGDDDEPLSPYESVNPNDEPQRPDGLWMPWRTSTDCFHHLHRIMGMKIRGLGRPRKNSA
jgi:hypothetical protein